MTDPRTTPDNGGALPLSASPVRPTGGTPSSIPDLHHFFDGGKPIEQRECDARSRELAARLLHFLKNQPRREPAAPGESGTSIEAPSTEQGSAAHPSLELRIITDPLIRSEADRDQNVYLGELFTRKLTHAVPDVIFLPADAGEAAAALRFARQNSVPITLRGAASTAMGGSVPHDGGITLDLSRLDAIEVDGDLRLVNIGAGARLRSVHKKLSEHGLALRVYPSNLGGTFAGWFATGGIGMNAYCHGAALDNVDAAEILLPDGQHLCLHRDGHMDVIEPDRIQSLEPHAAVQWFERQQRSPLKLEQFAGSEGSLGIVLTLTVLVEKTPDIGAFLLGFQSCEHAFQAIRWLDQSSDALFARPANVKLLSVSHLQHVRKVRKDEDSRSWKAQPSALSNGSGMPWLSVTSPAGLGAVTHPDRDDLEAYLFVDFLSLEAARELARALEDCPGTPLVLGEESARFALERFKPQQTKRLGPGLLAAEILMPAEEVPAFLRRAEILVRRAGNHLDAEVYYLSGGLALFIAGYLTDHRSAAFHVDLMLAPALLDLAMSEHHARPYVLGRWQSAYAEQKLGRTRLQDLIRHKNDLDPGRLINRGVVLQEPFFGALGAVVTRSFVPAVALLRRVYQNPVLSLLVRTARALLRHLRGPASGRGEIARIGAPFECSPPEHAAAVQPIDAEPGEQRRASSRALHCVNCGECNSVCPIFHESKIRLPQMLTHLGEALHGGHAIDDSGKVLLDLCMRCGNCQEVCQAGIPHLPLYEEMQSTCPPDERSRERHVAILKTLRPSSLYRREFLEVREGGYLKRADASLPGISRYLLLRAENDKGPAATCIHCGACVSVCPTAANEEFKGLDPRWITTEQNKCIGCGTCVEVCPANQGNGGQTLRVVETPALEWFQALAEFERQERS